MVDYVDGVVDEPPPEVEMWLRVRDWGDPWGKGWMAWPAKLFTRTRVARNLYSTYQSYHMAEDKLAWQKKNPLGMELIGLVKQHKFARDDEGKGEEPGPETAVRRWERWQNGM